jgi:cell division protein FtsZ
MGEDFTFIDDNDSNLGCGYHNIKVLGIGGCGNKAVNQLISLGLKGPDYIGANTDPQDLKNCLAPTKILLGEKRTRRRGCGGNPKVGREACLESLDSLKTVLKETDLVFVVAGLGGGTGSGGAPVVVETLAQFERPPLIVAVVTTPFSWETHRKKIADDVLAELTKTCNSIITISNSNVEKFAPKDGTMDEAVALANDVLYKALAGIIDILNTEGKINNDFSDIEAVLECRGPAFMASGEASGENRAKKAFQNATNNPIMSEQSIKGARRILVNIFCDKKLLRTEYEEINKLAAAEGASDVIIFSGWAEDESLAESGSIKVTILATGLDNAEAWDATAGDVINLDVLADEPDLTVRAEPDSAKDSRGPQDHPLTRGNVVDLSQPQPRTPNSPPPNPAIPKSPARRVMGNPIGGGRQGQTGQFSRYEQNAGVDPANNNSDFYDTPTFFRNNAN